jgi:hypothetical protein
VLTPKIRQFGYIPNTQNLQPGDVVLVTGNNLAAWLIRTAQERGGFHPDHARWTHAALYIGNGLIVEATPRGGVSVGQFVDMTFSREILVRRRLAAQPPFATEQRLLVAIQALTGLRAGYSLTSVPSLAWQAMRGVLWRTSHVRGVTICSTVVRDAYTTAPHIDLVPGQTGVIWPADLSLTPELDDVVVNWVKVVA